MWHPLDANHLHYEIGTSRGEYGVSVGLAETLVSLGLSKSVAEVLVYLLANGGGITDEIIDGTPLGKGQVATGLRIMRNQGWVVTTQEQHMGQGRGTFRWELNLTPNELYRNMEREVEQRVLEIRETLRDLESIDF